MATDTIQALFCAPLNFTPKMRLMNPRNRMNTRTIVYLRKKEGRGRTDRGRREDMGTARHGEGCIQGW
jgi:hypothetical protein